MKDVKGRPLRVWPKQAANDGSAISGVKDEVVVKERWMNGIVCGAPAPLPEARGYLIGNPVADATG